MTPHQRPPDWQLPRGVTPGLWDYLHNADLARDYLDQVSSSPFAQVDQRFISTHLKSPCTVIDLGCGPGRSLLPLASRGFQCSGVDLAGVMLTEAKKNFDKVALPVSLIQANIAEQFPLRSESFTAALCLFGTLGMLHPASARHQLLTEIHRILEPDGTFLLHVHNKKWDWKSVFPGPPFGHDSGVVTMPIHQGIANLRMKLFSLKEITYLTNQVGFNLLDCWHLDPDEANGLMRPSQWAKQFRAAGFLLALRKQSK